MRVTFLPCHKFLIFASHRSNATLAVVSGPERPLLYAPYFKPSILCVQIPQRFIYFRPSTLFCNQCAQMSLYKFLNDLYHFCNPAPVNSSCSNLALIDGTRSGPPSPRQILRFLPFRDQWPDLGLPGVPWLLQEPHRPHLNGRRVNKCSLHPPLGPSFGPNFGPEAPTFPTSRAKSSMIYIFYGIPRASSYNDPNNVRVKSSTIYIFLARRRYSYTAHYLSCRRSISSYQSQSHRILITCISTNRINSLAAT